MAVIISSRLVPGGQRSRDAASSTAYRYTQGESHATMKKIALLALLPALAFGVFAQQPATGVRSVSEPCASIRQKFLEVFNAQDMDGVLALYSEDAVLASDGGIFHGRGEIRQWVQSGFDQKSRLESIEPIVERNSGTLAYGTGRTRRRVGSQVHLGQYIIVMEKIRGEWKITQHFSLSAGIVPGPDRPSAVP
jgi:ketosteroid isomerase-like protein